MTRVRKPMPGRVCTPAAGRCGRPKSGFARSEDIDVRQLRTAAECWDQLADGGTLMENQTRRTRKTKQSERSAEPLPEPAPDSPPTVLALIERVVLDPHADVEKLDRMMTMYERLKAKEAELAFNGAKGRILKKLA